MSSKIELIAGLGNPGARYESNRHNVGFWFIDRLANANNASLSLDSKFQGEAARINIGGDTVWLLKPMTFMNLSGQSVAALARYYKIAEKNILVVHDELDIPPGSVRLKQGGGHGGHNGLRDIISHFNTKEFMRLRVGIGHPGNASQVSNYVLGDPSGDDRILISNALDKALSAIPDIVSGEHQKAMHYLHSE